MDPTDVVTSVVDDNGNEIPIGDQKDIGEFNLVFFSRIDEGLELSKKKRK
jgi:ubiquitin carboxyl-terminal hydrolase 25/28